MNIAGQNIRIIAAAKAAAATFRREHPGQKPSGDWDSEAMSFDFSRQGALADVPDTDDARQFWQTAFAAELQNE